MNKRQFKKAITSLGSGIVAEMFNLVAASKGADRVSADESLSQIWNAMEEAKRKANVTFGKKARDFESTEAYLKAKHEYLKNAYKEISKQFSLELDEGVKKFNQAMPSKKA